ncbi:MAG: hypothetical protein HPY57_08545 [Ignavibacteria bacterium]|jgi:hypothetical protein|nr:hypothetical protein [Ignavibacteria bacterium]
MKNQKKNSKINSKSTNKSKVTNSKKDKVNRTRVKKVKESEVVYSKKIKRLDDSWDFRGANTKEYTHCFHIYPAINKI